MDLMEVFKDYNPERLSSGQIRMMCPFRENHPDDSGKMSFFVTPDKGFYHCFSCGKGGKLLSLLTTMFGVSYSDALEMSAFTDYTPSKKEIWELDRKWTVTPPKEFTARGFKKETLEHFRFGYTDDDWILIPFYKSFRHPTDLLGYQRRRNIPDRVVINSKGFKKADYLYNLDTTYDYVIVVEGYSDVLRLYQHGYNAVALLGSLVSDWQIEQISKFKHVYLALDNDLPGREATERVYYKLKDLVADIKLIPYQTKDPGECISPKIWSRAFKDSTDYMSYSISMSVEWEGYIAMRDEIIRKLHYTD